MSVLALAACTGIVESAAAEEEPGTAQVGSDLPCDVAAVLNGRCVSCHGAPGLPGVPVTLLSYADLSAPSVSDPERSNVELAVQRMQDAAKPMPPGFPPPNEEVAILQAWIAAGLPPGSCGSVDDPYDTPEQCSSRRTWTGGDEESPHMYPGRACIACHERGEEAEGPDFLLAGTVYPTAHEPNDCLGSDSQATIRIVGADGRQFDLRLESSGNFFLEEGSLTLPYTAALLYDGRVRVMATPQNDGDCNGCHTPAGKNGAPGRIMLP